MNAKNLPNIVIAFFFGIVLTKILDQNTGRLSNLLNKTDERKAAPIDPSSLGEATGTATDTSLGVEKAEGDAETKKESASEDTPKNPDGSPIDGANTAGMEDDMTSTADHAGAEKGPGEGEPKNTTETGVDSGDGEVTNVGSAPGKQSGEVKDDKKGDEAQSGAITVSRGSSPLAARVSTPNKSSVVSPAENARDSVTTNDPTDVCPPDICLVTDMVEYENDRGDMESIHYRDLLWDVDGMNPVSSPVDLEWTNQ